MEQRIRKFYLVIVDMALINLAFLVSFLLHYEGDIPQDVFAVYIRGSIVITVFKLAVYRQFQLYSSFWEYASIEELIKIIKATSLSSIVAFLYLIMFNINAPLGVYVVTYILEVGFIGGVRFLYRIARRYSKGQLILKQDDIKRVLIVGSGSTACLVATEIKNHPDVHGMVVGFIDDDLEKYKKTISGIRVIGNSFEIYGIASRYKVDEIIIAMPTLSPKELKVILDECKRTDAKVRILPGVREIIGGQVSMNKIRDVEIEDLLGRDPVDLNVVEVAGYLEDKKVVVTGGGGSIGSEICRQILRFNPAKLVIIDIYENNAYNIHIELKEKFPDTDIDVIIASVRDRENMFRIFEKIKPNVVFHAAAHKHVPLMERTPNEAVKNNTFGTMNVAEAAMASEVSSFVLISTDKAVNPTNIMGASKRMAEMVIQGLAKRESSTKFVAVRFGNVLGSNGSVIPLFKKQIIDGGPVTVTHKDIIRYFMTIPEAAQLVIQAGAIAKGGEVFVLDMGDPVRIYDLAIDLIKLSGLKPHDDIEVKIVGLRPGEKLYEELLLEGEGLENTNYNKIYIGKPHEIDYQVLKKSFESLIRVIEEEDSEETVLLVKRIVPNYRDNEEVNEEVSEEKKNTVNEKV